MSQIHPQIIEKDGKKEFVVLPYEEFRRLEEELADYHDLRALREAQREEGDAPTKSLEEVRKELGLEAKSAEDDD